jgi:hypothetical protein
MRDDRAETRVESEVLMSNKNRDGTEGSSERNRPRIKHRHGHKTKWVEPHAPSADDPLTPEEMEGHNLLGKASVRGGAIPGVSDPARDGHGAPSERPDDVKWDGPRLNPPELDAVPGEGGSEEIG